MRISLLFRGGRSKPEVKKAEEIKEYANILAFSWRKKQAGRKKAKEIKFCKNIIDRKAGKLV